jgi:murein DD-endopeptidase MepM/ murein hydrolase activator NlpD
LGRNKKGSSFGILFLLALVIGGAGYIYTATIFERDKPEITLEHNGYWNLKTPLKLAINDISGLNSYKVIIKTKSNEVELEVENFMQPEASVVLDLKAPRTLFGMKENELKIIVEATDASKWNFTQGNSVIKEFKLIVDKRRPQVNIVGNSYKISKGGSAVVIFKAADDNLKELYIHTHDKKFIAQPFYKEGYYISLLAWPVTSSSFKAFVVAEDFAGNKAKANIPLYIKDKPYRVSKIKLSDKFLKGKIAELAEVFEETYGVEDSIEQFKLINETVRAKNEALIHEITSKVSDEMISDFKMNKMYPLKNAKVVAYFGDHRKYSYKNDKIISEAYHLGLDLASNAMAKIIPQNGGEVVFADFNGLYGNMPIIHHGLGLYTLYGHCSSITVNESDAINAKAHIANTGKSGYAMGDHLHFGVLVQGIEVRPQEWMDKEWIKLNINDVIKSSKEIIDRS